MEKNELKIAGIIELNETKKLDRDITSKIIAV